MENDTELSFTIYSTPGCPWCERAKNLCNENGIPYTEIMVSRDIERDVFLEQFPHVKSAPHITYRGKTLGGYSDLENFFANKQ